MKLIKCPRCELNYIQEGEKYCKVCYREMKGEQAQDEMELCSVCNAAPALPGKDVCLSCLKEMQQNGSDDDDDDDPESVDESSIGLNSVSTMDEIIPQVHEDIPAGEASFRWKASSRTSRTRPRTTKATTRITDAAGACGGAD
jgi:hypothetical protein